MVLFMNWEELRIPSFILFLERQNAVVVSLADGSPSVINYGGRRVPKITSGSPDATNSRGEVPRRQTLGYACLTRKKVGGVGPEEGRGLPPPSMRGLPSMNLKKVFFEPCSHLSACSHLSRLKKIFVKTSAKSEHVHARAHTHTYTHTHSNVRSALVTLKRRSKKKHKMPTPRTKSKKTC